MKMFRFILKIVISVFLSLDLLISILYLNDLPIQALFSSLYNITLLYLIWS